MKRIKYFIYRKLGKQFRNYFLDCRADLSNLSYLKHFRFCKVKKTNIFYFVIDPKFKHHPGLADRLKAILGCYYIAKSNGYQFKIIDLMDNLPSYLVPSKVNWIADTSELQYSIQSTKLIAYSASACKINCKLKKNKQYQCHIYRGDDLFFQNGEEYEKPFFTLFNEMFKPSVKIIKLLESVSLAEKQYNAIHVRFVNALGTFESSRYPTLSKEKANKLVTDCIEAIKKKIHTDKNPIVVFSDSKYFLEQVKRQTKAIVLSTDNIAHMSFDNSEDALSKMYMDFFLISRAAKVYRLQSPELRPTNFSVYAAIAGGNSIEDINI